LDSQSSPLLAQFSQIIAPQRWHSLIVLASAVRLQWPHSIMDMLSTPSMVYYAGSKAKNSSLQHFVKSVSLTP
jgi:hypothetical protein